jgi:hypothetical protein
MYIFKTEGPRISAALTFVVFLGWSIGSDDTSSRCGEITLIVKNFTFRVALAALSVFHIF